jgi:hypothetical protein
MKSRVKRPKRRRARRAVVNGSAPKPASGLQRALDMAETNPLGFIGEARRVVVDLERDFAQARAVITSNPGMVRDAVMGTVVSQVAKRIKRKISDR